MAKRKLETTEFVQVKDVRKRYVYALRLEMSKYYVGATGSLFRRLSAHFLGNGGAKATKEVSPIGVEIVYQVEFFEIAGAPGWKIIEALLAAEISQRLGAERVRGALHGEGWSDSPSDNQMRTVRRYRNYLEKGRLSSFGEKIRKLDFGEMNCNLDKKVALSRCLYDSAGFSIDVY